MREKALLFVLAVAMIVAFLCMPLLLRPDQPGRTRSAAARGVEWIRGAVLGESINVDGSVARLVSGGIAAAHTPVYVSLQLADVPARAELRVRWFGPSGRLLHEDRAIVTTGMDCVAYALPREKVSAAGMYVVEVLSGSRRYLSRQFTVTPSGPSR